MSFDVAADPVCKIEGCGKPAGGRNTARGWCRSHYDRWRTHGNPLAGNTPRGSCRDFIEEAARGLAGDECLMWPFAQHPDGYGNVNYPGFVTKQAHRIVCILAHGEPPEPGLDAAHSCGNAGCCNPHHLRWATRAENNADKIVHGTQTRGETHPAAKLSDPEVLEIRRRAQEGEAHRTIAASFGISEGYVWAIKSKAQWSHILD